MLSRVCVSAALLLSVACQAAPSAADAAFAAPPPSARSVERETDTYDFSYSYPEQAVAIPALNAFFEKDLRDSEAEIARQTAEEKAEAEKEGFPFRPHYLAVAWGVAADLPGWLSMSAGIETYSGGAHGNQGFDSLLWDRAENTQRAVADLFRSEDALRNAIRADFCDALDREREEKRGEPVVRDEDSLGFNACIDPLENTVVLESEGGQRFDGISVLVGPYMAGPYVEGSYIVELPVTDAVRAAVRPEYADAFGPGS